MLFRIKIRNIQFSAFFIYFVPEVFRRLLSFRSEVDQHRHMKAFCWCESRGTGACGHACGNRPEKFWIKNAFFKKKIIIIIIQNLHHSRFSLKNWNLHFFFKKNIWLDLFSKIFKYFSPFRNSWPCTCWRRCELLPVPPRTNALARSTAYARSWGTHPRSP